MNILKDNKESTIKYLISEIDNNKIVTRNGTVFIKNVSEHKILTATLNYIRGRRWIF
mgnify:FL=1|tara:strand:+ start:1056 stop:1226 length:171 start_codon:yes stop_codon:yes gene_type:complete